MKLSLAKLSLLSNHFMSCTNATIRETVSLSFLEKTSPSPLTKGWWFFPRKGTQLKTKSGLELLTTFCWPQVSGKVSALLFIFKERCTTLSLHFLYAFCHLYCLSCNTLFIAWELAVRMFPFPLALIRFFENLLLTLRIYESGPHFGFLVFLPIYQ